MHWFQIQCHKFFNSHTIQAYEFIENLLWYVASSCIMSKLGNLLCRTRLTIALLCYVLLLCLLCALLLLLLTYLLISSIQMPCKQGLVRQAIPAETIGANINNAHNPTCKVLPCDNVILVPVIRSYLKPS